jgi:DNA-binding IclR family transcriptional regulator
VLERGAKGEVRVGMLLFELGQLASRQRSVREAAQPFLADLHEATGLTTHLGLLDQDAVVYIDKIPAVDGPQLPSRVGGRMPLYCTAIGKVLLAFGGDELIRSVVGGELRRRTPYTTCMPGPLLQQLERVRQTGLAYEQEESTRGVVCVASPVTNRAGKVIAALSISGWSNRVEIPKSAQAVRTAALALSRQIKDGTPLSASGISAAGGVNR